MNRIKHPSKTITIAIAGKYAEMPDAYLSVLESCKHAGAYLDTKVVIKWLLTEDIHTEDQITQFIKEHDIKGFIVPGGF